MDVSSVVIDVDARGVETARANQRETELQNERRSVAACHRTEVRDLMNSVKHETRPRRMAYNVNERSSSGMPRACPITAYCFAIRGPLRHDLLKHVSTPVSHRMRSLSSDSRPQAYGDASLKGRPISLRVSQTRCSTSDTMNVQTPEGIPRSRRFAARHEVNICTSLVGLTRVRGD